MQNIIDMIKRNSLWLLLGLVAMLLINPENPEIKTLLLILLVEASAIGLSALAVYTYTKVDFVKEGTNQLGMIFLGVHICVGFVVMGVYIAQFTI